MSRIEHSRDIDGKQIIFGVDAATKTLDVPVNMDAHEFIQAIAFEFADVSPEDYPLEPCISDEDGRQLNLAPGWSISVADRAKLRRVSPNSTH